MILLSSELSKLVLKCFDLFVKYRLVNHGSSLVSNVFGRLKNQSVYWEKRFFRFFLWKHLKCGVKPWFYFELLLNILQTTLNSWNLTLFFSGKRIPIIVYLLYTRVVSGCCTLWWKENIFLRTTINQKKIIIWSSLRFLY